MRNLFLILLLANIGYFTWTQWLVSPDSPGGTTADTDSAPTLQLVTEVQAGQAAGASSDQTRLAMVAEDTAAAGTGNPDRCVSMGPFVELTQAAEAITVLTAGGFSPKQRLAEGEIWSGYRVQIPSLPSREAANQVLASLQQHNISEQPYVVPGGDYRNAISLGIYSEFQRAQRRANEVRPLGFEPEIAIWHRMGQVYWIDFKLGDDQAIDPVDFKSMPEQIMRLDERECG